MALVPRISSGAVQGPIGSDPLTSQRPAAGFEQQVSETAQEVERLKRTVEADQARGAEHFGRIEGARRGRELSAALDQVSQQVPESGAGFSELALAELKRVQAESRARAGADPMRLKVLDKEFELEREEYLKEFEKGERDQARTYLNFEFMRNHDDAQQRVSRGQFVDVAPNRLQGFKASMARTESGGNYREENSEGFVGKYQFGDDRLADFMDAHGVEFTKEEFKKSPELQERVMDWHIADIDRQYYSEGLDRYEGQVIGGVVMSHDGFRAMAHLGGYEGAKKFLSTRGQYNPDDSNETRLSDYADIHGVDAFGIPKYYGALPDLKKSKEFQDELKEAFIQIDAMPLTKLEKAEMKRNAEADLTRAALSSIVQVNPEAGLAVLRSGELDAALGYDTTSRLEGALISDQKAILEKQIAAQAKARRSEEKRIAQDLADDWISANLNGSDEMPPQPSTAQLELLSREKQRAVMSAEGVGASLRLVETADPSELPAIMAQLKPSGENHDFEQDAYDAAKKVADERLDLARVQTQVDYAVSNGLAPNMGDKDVAREIDRRFAGAMGDEPQLSDMIDFVGQYRVVPDAFGEAVAAALGGDNPQARAAMVEAVGQINQLDPNILAGEGGAIKRALELDAFMRTGLPLEKAQELAGASLNPTEAKSRRALFDKTVKGEGLSTDAWRMMEEKINEASDSRWNTDDLLIPESVWGEYQDTVREEFARTGNLDVSVELAVNSFLSRHSITRVGGVETWQKDAPEKVYAVYGDVARNTAWIEGQAGRFLKKQGVKGRVLSLEVDQGSGRAEAPAYRVLYEDESGAIQVEDGFTPNRDAELVAHNEEDISRAHDRKVLSDYRARQAKYENADSTWRQLREDLRRAKSIGLPTTQIQELYDEASANLRSSLKELNEMQEQAMAVEMELIKEKFADRARSKNPTARELRQRLPGRN